MLVDSGGMFRSGGGGMEEWCGVEWRGSCKISDPWSFSGQCDLGCIHSIRKILSSQLFPMDFPRTGKMETHRAEPCPSVAITSMYLVSHIHLKGKHPRGFPLRSQVLRNGWNSFMLFFSLVLIHNGIIYLLLIQDGKHKFLSFPT